MNKEKVTENLERQKAVAKAYYESSQYKDLWANDIIALDCAIKKIKEDKSYMSSYWEGAWHTVILILLVKFLLFILSI